MAVILWHAGLSFQGRALLPGGFLGVDVFFVISGFLMARIWTEGISVKEFAARRLRRILPMLFATILVCVPFAIWLMGPSARAEFGADAIASTLLVPNIFYSFQDSYWAAPGKLRPLLHLWTIGVEMQFYLICPVIFLALKKWGKPMLGLSVISVLSFAAAMWFSLNHPDLAFYNLPTRLWEFGMGALIFYSPRLKASDADIYARIGLTLILVSFILVTEAMWHPGFITIFPVCGAYFILAGDGHSAKPNMLNMRLLRRIGLISFSAYLIHQPLFAFTRIATGQTELPLLVSLGLIGATLILSDITYRFIETPLRRPGKGRAAVTLSLGAIALICGILMARGPHSTVNTEALLIKPDRWILNAAGTRCVNKEVVHRCRLGNSDIAPTIALLGDNHIQAMAGGFDEFFIAQNVNDIDLSMGGCPFIMGVRRYARKYPCDDFVEDVFEQLTARNIKTAIILDRRNAYLLGEGATYNDGTKEPADLRLYPTAMGQDGDANMIQAENERLHIQTIKRLRDMGIKVILIYPVPEIGIHVPDALAERVKAGELPLTLNRELHEARQAPLEALKRLAAGDAGIIEFDPAEIFCDDMVCRTHGDTEVYYTDRDHLSRAGTALVLEEVGDGVLGFVAGGN